MKIKEYNQMMSYLTRPSDKMKGKFVKVRKPNAVPPKTKTFGYYCIAPPFVMKKVYSETPNSGPFYSGPYKVRTNLIPDN